MCGSRCRRRCGVERGTRHAAVAALERPLAVGAEAQSLAQLRGGELPALAEIDALRHLLERGHRRVFHLDADTMTREILNDLFRGDVFVLARF